MDIFSFLPIIIFIYAIATMFSPKNKAPRNRRQNPFPPQGTWRERVEELERQMFPQEVARKPRPYTAEPARRPGSESFGNEGYAGTEGFGTQGTLGSEGASDAEGTWGAEGTFGSEGTIGVEGYYPNLKGTLTSSLSPEPNLPELQPQNIKQQEIPFGFPRITEDSLMQGVIWAEILGKPRARGGWSYSRKR